MSKHQWSLTDYHCQGCGLETVYEEDSCDPEMGNRFMCVECGSTFFLPDCDTSEAELAALRQYLKEKR